jgi:hypothetical protein
LRFFDDKGPIEASQLFASAEVLAPGSGIIGKDSGVMIEALRGMGFEPEQRKKTEQN